MINHIGNLDAGHYTSYIRQHGNLWFHCNDHQILPASMSQVEIGAKDLFYFDADPDPDPGLVLKKMDPDLGHNHYFKITDLLFSCN